jgi:hypothetical protein
MPMPTLFSQFGARGMQSFTCILEDRVDVQTAQHCMLPQSRANVSRKFGAVWEDEFGYNHHVPYGVFVFFVSKLFIFID